MKKIAFLVTACVAVAAFGTWQVNKTAASDPFDPMATHQVAASDPFDPMM